MKKILVISSFAMLAACNSPEPAKTDVMKTSEDSTVQVQDITSPYPIRYSSKFAMGDPKHAETILTLWKDWDNGNLSAHKEIFADSLELHFADGSIMHSVRDSVLAAGQSYRNMFATVVSSVDAIMAAKSTDKNENWALIWGKEISTDKKGKVDSSYLQETWRFNKDGKADLMFQYKAVGVPPKK
jgi:hypothetical protein